MYMNEFQRLIEELMLFTGFDQVTLAKKLAVTQSTVSRWRKGAEPKAKARYRIEEFIKKVGFRSGTPLGGRIPVMGKVGAGAEILPEFEQVPADGLYEIETSMVMPVGAIAFEVEGVSMYPRFMPGDVVVCVETQDDRGGFEAAVRTVDGRRYLKMVTRTATPGCYDLESHNAPLMRAIALVWIGKIHAIFPSGQWARR